jgi:RecA/RadA recombinase
MAPRKKVAPEGDTTKANQNDDFTAELINSLNKDIGHRVAYNLASDQSPTHVKRWISTGSKQLDYIVSNRRDGGLPEGRIIEIFGPPSIGKSHIATHIARSTQAVGGIVVYIDTENATNPENLKALGVDISKRFVYVDTHCTEEVFDIAEKTILKAKAVSRNVPITIIWDSVAASSPKAELEGAYDKDTIGLQARVISKGMRKITGVIGDQSVLFVCLNQIRTKIGCVAPETMVTVRKSKQSKKQQISSFFEEAGFSYLEMELNKFYPLSGWEILTHSPDENVWKKVTHLVRKDPCVPVIVNFGDSQLSVSPEHRFWVSTNGVEDWVEALDLVEEKSNVFLFHESGNWVKATFSAGEKEVEILDLTVEGTESYFSEGILSHNTMYGDPTTVPGGNAIPFHASVRIKLGAGQQIKVGEDVVGINVSAKTIKNKVGPPFRSANFRIIFGKGIEEHEELFDLLREIGEVTLDDGTVINVSGTGSWKNLAVTNPSKEVIVDKKFYKSGFGDVMQDPETGPWVSAMLEKSLVKSSVTAADVDIDPESYEDVRALADQLTDASLDVFPE